MGSGYARKKKEAKALQKKFQEMQEQLKDEKIIGTSGNGLVTITINGEHQVQEVQIKPECVDPDDIEGLEDLVRAAFNDAAKKLEKSTSSGMGGFPSMDALSGLGL